MSKIKRLLPGEKLDFNIQLFAEKEIDADAEKTETGKESTETQEAEDVKDLLQMSQEDLDKKLAKVRKQAKSKAKQEYEKSDEFKAFRAWQESNKTDEQKTTDKIKQATEMEAELERLRNENKIMRTTADIMNKGVDPIAVDFVQMKAKNLAAADNLEYSDAVDQVIKSLDKKFFVDYQTSTTTIAGGKERKQKADKTNMNEMRRMLGLQPK